MKKLLQLFFIVLIFLACDKTSVIVDEIQQNGNEMLKGGVHKINVPGDYATIQEAVDNADDGAVIMVGPGNYEGATIAKSVTIKGKGGVVINNGPLLTTYMPCGTIVLNTGFFFDGTGTGSGTTISNLTFDGLAFPVFSRGADNITVEQCTMDSPVQGITNWSGNDWDINHNVITNLRSANGGGIGIFIGDNSGFVVADNMITHNKISGVLNVAECDRGGYAGSGIVLFADFRWNYLGAEEIKNNKVLHNKISLTSNNAMVVDVVAFELTDSRNDPSLDPVIFDNKIGFNDFRGTELQISLTPENLAEYNVISKNLGDNRGHGVHPSAFK